MKMKVDRADHNHRLALGVVANKRERTYYALESIHPIFAWKGWTLKSNTTSFRYSFCVLKKVAPRAGHQNF